jgi:GNAT-family acetyltransferase (TIGR03103 family)
MSNEENYRRRLTRNRSPSVTGEPQYRKRKGQPKSSATIECGWGRLIFAHTFDNNRELADVLLQEQPDKRDIAFYVRDPHVVLAMEPQAIFLDPSHTYRLWLHRYRVSPLRPRGFTVRLLNSQEDAEAVHRLYLARQMLPPSVEFVYEQRASRQVNYFMALDNHSGQVLGAAVGIDHVEVFDDPESGSSLWALVVDSQAAQPGIGQAIVRHMTEFFIARGREYMDLSVMHDNRPAIRLYERLGFERVPVFSLKNRNSFNEPLFVGELPEATLNPYAEIIVREAQRRGIAVRVLDADAGYFELSFGGRSIICRESLSELTTAIAMSRCDDKVVTHRLIGKAGLRVPAQLVTNDSAVAEDFLQQRQSVVVKPARGEQGAGISVDVRSPQALEAAMAEARKYCETVVLEEFVRGEDLRIIVIDNEVVAAAVRRPAQIKGNGSDTIRHLIEKQSRRREAATKGESRIPIDAETARCIADKGYDMDDVLPYSEYLVVRKTANLHTGGTIHDVTAELHPVLRHAAISAAQTLQIPVTGLDMIVPSPAEQDYVIIEANERPGLANHEPQPTAERFVDLLFPQTVAG